MTTARFDADHRVQAKWLFLVLLLALMLASGLLRQAAAAQPVDDLDWRRAPNALGLALDARPEQEERALFRWTIDAGRGVICDLDADGDGDFDHRISDCARGGEVSHVFTESGVFHATMTAHAEDGRAGVARVRVEVR